MSEPKPMQVLTRTSLYDVASAIVSALTENGERPLYERVNGRGENRTVCFGELDPPGLADVISSLLKRSLLADDKAHECEMCSQVFFGDHYSAEDCNVTGLLVALCKPCAEADAATALEARKAWREEQGQPIPADRAPVDFGMSLRIAPEEGEEG